MDEAKRFIEFKRFHEKEDLVEEIIREFYEAILEPSDSVAIDGGCHKGFHTFPLAKCCKFVLGLDANQDMCRFLTDQLARAGVVNCKVVHAAVQDSEQLKNVTFYVADSFLGRSSLTRLWDAIDTRVEYRAVSAPATTLDRLVDEERCGAISFIKLDLEGGEYRALLGAKAVLQQDSPVLVMENSIHAAKQGGFLETDPFDYLTGLGYVLLTPSAQVVTREQLFPFWYLFAVPKARFEALTKVLYSVYDRICISRGVGQI